MALPPFLLRFQVLPDLTAVPLFDIAPSDPEAVRVATNSIAAYLSQHRRDVEDLIAKEKLLSQR